MITLSHITHLVRSPLLLLLLLLAAATTRGQTNGDYRSRATGNWSASGTWSVYNNGWVNASNYPGQATGAGNVLIQDGYTGLTATTHKVRIKDANGCESANCP